jgi:hypothetical protein
MGDELSLNFYFLKFYSIFIISLIISFSFSSAIIYSSTVYGNDKVDGAVAGVDNVFINITGSENFTFYSNENEMNMNCKTLSDGKIECNKLFSFSDINSYGKKSFNLKGEQSGNLEKIDFIVDGIKPNFDYEILRENAGVKVVYSVNDRAGEDDLSCSNIKKIDFYVDNSLKHSEVLNLSPSFDGCIFNSNFYVDMSGVSGGVEYYFEVYDNVGNYYMSDVDFFDDADFLAPIIDNDFMIVYSRSNNVLEKLPINPDEPLMVDIAFYVTDESDIVSGSANLTDLYNDPIVSYENYNNFYCEYMDEFSKYLCRFSGIFLSPQDGVIDFSVKVFDDDGNFAIKEFNKIYDTVSSDIEVVNLKTNDENCFDDKCFVKNGINEFNLLINSNSEFDFANVYLNIGQTKAASCFENDGLWECKFFVNYNENGRRLNVGVMEQLSADDFGNHFSSDIYEFFLDNENPIIESNNVFVNNDLIGFDNFCPTSSDFVEFKLNVSDDSPSIAIGANVSLYSNSEIVLGECLGIGNHNFECSLQINGFIDNVEDIKTNIYVKDLAGNVEYLSNFIDDSFNTCISQDGTPNLINSINLVNFENNCIDGNGVCVNGIAMRQKSSRIVFPVSFQSNGDIMYYEFGGCFANLNDNVSADDFVMNSFIQKLNNDEYADALLFVDLGGDGLYYDGAIIDLECEFRFKLKNNNFVYDNYEEDVFSQEIKVEDKFEDINMQVQSKIKKTKSRLKQLDRKLSKREGVLAGFKYICGTVEVVNKVKSTLSGVKSVVYAVSLLFEIVGLGDVVWAGINGAVIYPVEYLLGKVSLSGKYSAVKEMSLSITDIACGLVECSFYKSTGLLDLTLGVTNFVDRIGSFQSAEDAKTEKEKFNENFEKENNLEGMNEDEIESEIESFIDDLKEFDGDTELIEEIENNYNEYLKNLDDIDYINDYIASNDIDNQEESSEGFWSDIGDFFSEGYNDAKEDFKIGFVGNKKNGHLNYAYKSFDVSSDLKNIEHDFGAKFNKNLAAQEALAGDWIVNPYKSTKFDGLCLPAAVYNLKKEKQLQCKYLNCLKTVDKSGVPISVCEDMKELESCLYLEGAWTKQFDNGFIEMITNGMWDSISKSWPMIGVRIFDYFVCDPEGPNAVAINQAELSFPTGWLGIACSVEKSYFGFKEMMNFNDYSMYDKWNVDLNGKDFCEGVDYD